MKIILAVLFFLFTTSTFAQGAVNINWTTKTELKAKDVIYYDTARPLVWKDFAGVPKPSGRNVALTASGFGYNSSFSSNSDGSSIGISVFCYFSKPDSWVKPGSNTDYILSHEQHHLDITYIIAKKFIDKLKKEKITRQNLNILVQKIYKECQTELTSMQQQYDLETDHGINVKQQALWHEKVLQMLR